MKKQEIFNHVANHLLLQNARSLGGKSQVDGSPFCMYRGDNGLRCAVGCLIPDEVYSSHMEMNTVWGLSEEFKKVLPAYFQYHIQFLRDLQMVHDEYPTRDWPRLLDILGRRNDLDTRVVAHSFRRPQIQVQLSERPE